MIPGWVMTLLGAVGAALNFLMGSGELQGPVLLGVGAANAALSAFVGITHQGTKSPPSGLRMLIMLPLLGFMLGGAVYLSGCGARNGTKPTIDYEAIGAIGAASLCYELPDAERQKAASFIGAASSMDDDVLGALLQTPAVIDGPAARAVGAIWFGLTEFAKGEPTGGQYWRDYAAASRRMLDACARGLRRAGTVVGAGAA